jgi:ATP-binding cassette subfamily B protein
MFVALTSQLPNLINTITWYFPFTLNDISQQAMFCKDFKRLLDLPERKFGNTEFNGDFSELKFCNVYFKYPNSDKYILNNISFSIRNGEKLAIAGENGSGKSTIIKLMLGLYKPDRGSITIDGNDIFSLTPESLKRLFSVLFQDFYNYNLTLRENIALGNIERLNDDDAIKQAAQKGTADDIINNIGLDTYLGKIYKDGIDLSYGHWQRIAISRTIMANGCILILDEPTAALDPKAEAQIYESFLKSTIGKCSILISHRLGSTRLADKIIVINKGTVVEFGTHVELIGANGIYKNMFEAQAEWYKDEVKSI